MLCCSGILLEQKFLVVFSLLEFANSQLKCCELPMVHLLEIEQIRLRLVSIYCFCFYVGFSCETRVQILALLIKYVGKAFFSPWCTFFEKCQKYSNVSKLPINFTLNSPFFFFFIVFYLFFSSFFNSLFCFRVCISCIWKMKWYFTASNDRCFFFLSFQYIFSFYTFLHLINFLTFGESENHRRILIVKRNNASISR